MTTLTPIITADTLASWSANVANLFLLRQSVLTDVNVNAAVSPPINSVTLTRKRMVKPRRNGEKFLFEDIV